MGVSIKKSHFPPSCGFLTWITWEFTGKPGAYTVRKEMKCSGNIGILHELVLDTTQKSEKHELIRVVSRTNLCSISESQLHFISFLRMCEKKIGRLCYLCIVPQISPQSIFSHQILKQIFSLIFIEFKIA